MQDTALYQYLLGLQSPWTVSRVNLDGTGQRVVRRGRARKQARVVRRIGVDEKAAAKGHKYLTLVFDLDEGTVEHIVEDRKQESLDGSYAGLTQVQRDGGDGHVGALHPGDAGAGA